MVVTVPAFCSALFHPRLYGVAFHLEWNVPLGGAAAVIHRRVSKRVVGHQKTEVCYKVLGN